MKVMKVAIITALLVMTIPIVASSLSDDDSSATTFTYNLIFDDNFGSGGPIRMTATSSSNHYTFPIPGDIPTRSGYLFSGWTTQRYLPDERLSGDYFPGDTFRVSATSTTSPTNRTLYAVWVTGYTYRLEYSVPYGTTNYPSTQSYGPTLDESHTFTIPSMTPIRDGYVFNYWYLDGSHYQPGDTVTCTNMDPRRIMDARWTPTHTLTYDTNGGSFASQPTTTFTENTVVTLATNISKTGYVFAGWKLNGTTVTQVTMDSDKTVVADWTLAQYTVTFNATGGVVNPASKTVTYTQPYGELPTPVKVGYRFNGWFTSSNGGTQITASSTYSLTDNQTLFAHWTPQFTYVLTYDTNGGNNDGPPTETHESTSNTYTFTISNTTPTRSGYFFAGWTTHRYQPDEKLSGDYFPGDTFRVSATSTTSPTNRTLYATWVSGYTYRLEYDVPYGTTNYPSTQSYGPTMDESHTFTISSMIPIRDGYVFNYWYLYHGGHYQPGDTVTCTNMDPRKVMISSWTAIYTLTYDTNGGSFASPPTTTFTDGTVVTLATNISKTGYVFAGWKLNGTTVTQVTMDSDKTVVADWTPNQYTLTLNANGGNVSPATMPVYYEQEYGAMPTPQKPGYFFDGWYTQAVGGDLIVAENRYNTLGDSTVYAHWTENVVYWSNGNPNGLISILYRIDNPNVTNDIITKAHIYSFNPDITDDPATQINESFIDTGYYIQIEVLSTKIENSYNVKIIARLYDSNANMIVQNYYDFGSWRTFIVTIDTVNAKVDYTKVMGFRSFTDYEETISGTILSYASYGDFNNQAMINMSITPITDTVPIQSVVKTLVFLNTYGVVLRNPTLDVSTYFPEMTRMRLNFYSFALYGTSMTINGHTIPVIAPNVTIYYTQDGTGKNTIADEPGQRTLEKTIELTNIYITWDGTNCTLTFANENFTVDMGTYTNKTISFAGMWYFATGLYEPYTATESTYEVDWYNGFDLSTFGVIFATMLLLGALAIRVTIGARFMDYIIIVCGIIIALILAGGS